MNNNDRAKFVDVIVGFAEIKGRQLSAPAIEIYWRAMRDWPLDEFIQAAEHLLRTCEWFPTPKHFEDLRKANELGPHEAWLAVVEISKHWRTPEVLPAPESVLARAAKAVGGFREIALADTEKALPHIQRRFIEAYEEMGDRVESAKALPHMVPINLAPKINHGMKPISEIALPIRSRS